MTALEGIIFKKLTFKQCEELIVWAKQEGWNPGSYDALVFWNTDPDGFYGVFKADELIGGGAIVKYSNTYGFMGLFIMKPEYRSMGIGRFLWNRRRGLLLKRLGDNATIGMDGVVAMQPFYGKGGFKIAFKDERYRRIGEAMTVDSRIRLVTTEDVDAVVTYDAQHFGCARPQFIKPWMGVPETRSFIFVEQRTIQGLAILRKATNGYKIGPLFAEDNVIAEALYKTCLNEVVGEPVYLDIPVVNEEALALVKQYNATYVFECARMYYGQAPKTAWNKIYGITTFELG